MACNQSIWFDNLVVNHYESTVLEEEHYYPFGLTLNTTEMGTGITVNDIKFQNQKHETDFGIDIYSFKYREHDPTIGRFWQIDPLAEKYVYNSTYAFSENKVVNAVELEGLEAEYINAKAWRQVQYEFQSLANSIDNFFTVGSKTEVETEVAPNTTTTMTTTTTVGTNLGETMNFIIIGNTNKGNTAPLFKIKTETEMEVVCYPKR